MSDYTSNTTVNLQVNGQQAGETLANLRKRAADLQTLISPSETRCFFVQFAEQVGVGVVGISGRHGEVAVVGFLHYR